MDFEEMLSHEVVFSGKIADIHHDRVRLSNGKTSLREVISHPGAVAVLALKNGKLLLVRQFRYAAGREMLEIPAGKLEPGEAPAAAAVRELEEETGAVCEQMTLLGKYYGSPGILSEVISVYFAEITDVVAAHPDEDEFVSTEEVEIAEFAKMLADGEICDGKTVFAFSIAAAKGLLPAFTLDNSQSDER